MSDERKLVYQIVKSGDARIEIRNGKSYGDVYFPIHFIDPFLKYSNIQIVATQRIPDNGLPINVNDPIFNLYSEIIPEDKNFRIVAVEINHRPLSNYTVYFNYIVTEYKYL